MLRYRTITAKLSRIAQIALRMIWRPKVGADRVQLERVLVDAELRVERALELVALGRLQRLGLHLEAAHLLAVDRLGGRLDLGVGVAQVA